MRDSDKAINWERLGQIIGVIAAVAGWIAVVGGARMWARLHNAHIPTTQTLAVLPRQLLIVEGFQTLVAPLLIGGGVALLAYYSWPQGEAVGGSWTPTGGVWFPGAMRSDAPSGERSLARPLVGWKWIVKQTDRDWRLVAVGVAAVALLIGILTLTLLQVHFLWPLVAIVVGAAFAAAAALSGKWPKEKALSVRWPKAKGWLLVAAVAAPLVAAVVAVLSDVHVLCSVAVLLVTVGAIWLTVGALVDATRAQGAITLFAAFLLWAGAVSFLRELGLKHPMAEFQYAVVTRTNLPPLCGLYLGGAGGDVYVASNKGPHTVYLVPKNDVVTLSFSQTSRTCPAVLQPSRVSQLSLFALDEVVPDAHGFSFPIGGGPEKETYNLSFVASFRSPASGRVQRVALTAKTFTSNPGVQQVVTVPVVAIGPELQRGAPVLVTASVTSNTEHGSSSATYSMCVIGRRRGADEGQLKPVPLPPNHVIDLFPSRMVGDAPTC